MADITHDHWMREAMAMAEDALVSGEVPVGCVFVRDGAAIAKARNRTNQFRDASRHAELEAIDLILGDTTLTPPSSSARYPLANTTLYVTVEPCIMCASALRQLGICQVFYGCENDKFGGCGTVLGVNERLEHPVHPSYKATGGYLRQDAIIILRRFYATENTNGPSSLPYKGHVSASHAKAQGYTHPQNRHFAQTLLLSVDVLGLPPAIIITIDGPVTRVQVIADVRHDSSYRLEPLV